MVTTEEIRAALLSAFPDARIEVEDTTGGGDHFGVRIATSAFAGVGLVDQHRKIYAALGPLMQRIHALQLQTAAS